MTSKGRWEVDNQDYLIYTDYEEVDAPVRPVVAEKTVSFMDKGFYPKLR